VRNLRIWKKSINYVDENPESDQEDIVAPQELL
jgi:hypothetical protein